MRFLSESEIERKVCEYAEELGLIPIKVGKNGWPDRLIALHAAECLWIEFKARNGKLSALQRARIRQLLKIGHHVAIINSVESGKSLLDTASVSINRSQIRYLPSVCRIVFRSGLGEDVHCPDDFQDP